MSNLNWPEGATHYLDAGDEHARFRDLSGENWKFFNALTGQWSQHYFSSEELLSRRDLIPRPQPKPWSGPEDGLPPVGMTVEVFECTHDYTKRFNGQNVRILCHDNGTAVFAANNFEYHALIKDKFRAIRTPEQLAAEEREMAIREIERICTDGENNGIHFASALYDAGFKREVK